MAAQYFQIGDFCQRVYLDILGQPIPQQKSIGVVDMLLSPANRSQFQSRIVNGFDGKRYVISYQAKDCADGEAVDLCQDSQYDVYAPQLRHYEFSLKNAPKVYTKVVRITTDDFREWCDVDGGGAGYLSQVSAGLLNEIQKAYYGLEKAIITKLNTATGCYADGTAKTSIKTLQIFNYSGTVPILNPDWNTIIEADLAELGLSTDLLYVGGKQFYTVEKRAGYQTLNTFQGFDPSKAMFDNFGYSPFLQTQLGGNEKLMVISPEVAHLVTYSHNAGIFSNVTLDPSNYVGSLFSQMFNNTAKEQVMSTVITDPIKNLVWDVTVKLEQCGGSWTLDFQASLTYDLFVVPMTERICYNDCFTGIQVYQLCPQPAVETCDEPEPAETPTYLCLEATLPTPCSFTVGAGETVTFTRGAVTIDWVAPFTQTITSNTDFYLLLLNIFAGTVYGSWIINTDGDIQYVDNGTTSLAAGAGTIDGDCFADPIAFTIAECA